MTATTQVRPGPPTPPASQRAGTPSRHPGAACHRRPARRRLPRRAARARRVRRRRRVLRHLGIRHHGHAHARVGSLRTRALRALLLPTVPAAHAGARAHRRRRRARVDPPAEPLRCSADHRSDGHGRHAPVGQLRHRARGRRLLRRQRHDEPAPAHVVALGRGAVLPRVPGTAGPRLAAPAPRPPAGAGHHRHRDRAGVVRAGSRMVVRLDVGPRAHGLLRRTRVLRLLLLPHARLGVRGRRPAGPHPRADTGAHRAGCPAGRRGRRGPARSSPPSPSTTPSRSRASSRCCPSPEPSSSSSPARTTRPG